MTATLKLPLLNLLYSALPKLLLPVNDVATFLGITPLMSSLAHRTFLGLIQLLGLIQYRLLTQLVNCN
jgi:hypothetical protein